ncbi:DUF885 domain-containing protein [Phaeacidiphilus oryzae]|uniref:DUF885 domain-containing protein n=1 Tax=Phaeacidiphilus oryzae TaxID=348818 RepID=UPI00068D54CD|nr:DUF885 domain-containing protein [Phaeacidiphilus oryzae]
MPDTARSLADAYLAERAALDPTTSAYLGLNQEDESLGDYSPDGFAALAEQDRRTLAALDGLPGTARDDSAVGADRACARLLRERLTAQLAEYEAGDHLRSLNNISAPVHWVREIFTMRPAENEQDWSRTSGRLADLPRALDSYRASLAEGARTGRTVAPRQVATVVEQLTEWAEPSPWFSDFVAEARQINGVPDSLCEELDARAENATRSVLAFRDWLRTEYAPAAEGTPDAVGRERYLRAARSHSGSDLDLDEAYGWAWTEFHRLLAEQRVEAARILTGARDPEPLTAMRHLDAHGPIVHGVDQIRVYLQQLMDEAIDALDGTHFDITGPVRKVEAMIAPAGGAAAPYYSAPSLDFSRPGRTWLPTMGHTEFPTWQLVSTWYHEGVPGHHLQLAQWVACAEKLSQYQCSLGSVSANVEGWALYAERLMDELGFFSTPEHRIGFLDEQMLRTIRVIIDIGMHLGLRIPSDSPFHPGERWTPALGDAFFAAYNGSPADMRESEIVRYLGWPGQAIGYKLGERAWLAGREAAKSAALKSGKEFDLRTWHMAALSQGSLGLDDLASTLATLP